MARNARHRMPVAPLWFGMGSALLAPVVVMCALPGLPFDTRWQLAIASTVGSFATGLFSWRLGYERIVFHGPMVGSLVGAGASIATYFVSWYLLFVGQWLSHTVGISASAGPNPFEALVAAAQGGLLGLFFLGGLTLPLGAVLGFMGARGFWMRGSG